MSVCGWCFEFCGGFLAVDLAHTNGAALGRWSFACMVVVYVLLSTLLGELSSGTLAFCPARSLDLSPCAGMTAWVRRRRNILVLAELRFPHEGFAQLVRALLPGAR